MSSSAASKNSRIIGMPLSAKSTEPEYMYLDFSENKANLTKWIRTHVKNLNLSTYFRTSSKTCGEMLGLLKFTILFSSRLAQSFDSAVAKYGECVVNISEWAQNDFVFGSSPTL